MTAFIASTNGNIRIGSSDGTLVLNKDDGDDKQYICNNGTCKS